MAVILLPVLFFFTALIYASVGFGGGSTYNALLALNGVDFRILPTIALACNIIVVAGGVVRFAIAGMVPFRAILPFIFSSTPAAWLGGLVPVPELMFMALLSAVLLISGLQLAFAKPVPTSGYSATKTPTLTAIVSGGVIGFIAGLTGIGGGIFLAPLLYRLNWATPRRIAAACSLFILVNSIAGLVGQTMKLQLSGVVAPLLDYWMLPIVVLIGGQIGTWAAQVALPEPVIRRTTALLILYVSARLILALINQLFN